MGREKLAETLREKGEQRARQIWAEAELRAAVYRRDAEARCAAQRREEQGQHERQLARQLDLLHNRTARQLRRIRLAAEQTLAQRLRELARAELAVMPAARRRQVLQRLAAELPGLHWQQISVHPDDLGLAKELFPGCVCSSDPALGGGLVVAIDDAVRVDNSLTGRLDQAWPQLCGRLLDTLRETCEEDDAAPAD